MPDSSAFHDQVLRIGGLLAERGLFLAAAESCTGGLVSSLLTDVPGSSAWFVGAVVAYSNAVKERLLGVEARTLAAHGAVSLHTARAMAQGVCGVLGADAAVALSGIAGPDGGTPDKPVGTVCIGWTVLGVTDAERFLFSGGRSRVKSASAAAALAGLERRLARAGGAA